MVTERNERIVALMEETDKLLWHIANKYARYSSFAYSPEDLRQEGLATAVAKYDFWKHYRDEIVGFVTAYRSGISSKLRDRPFPLLAGYHAKSPRKMPTLVDVDKELESGARPFYELPSEDRGDAEWVEWLDIDAALAQMTAEDRLLLTRYCLEGWTTAELARAMECSGSTVCRQLRSAREQLRALLLRQAFQGSDIQVRE